MTPSQADAGDTFHRHILQLHHFRYPGWLLCAFFRKRMVLVYRKDDARSSTQLCVYYRTIPMSRPVSGVSGIGSIAQVSPSKRWRIRKRRLSVSESKPYPLRE